MKFPMDRKVLGEQPVTVEFDCRGKRVRRTLPNSYEARSFYRRTHQAAHRRSYAGPGRRGGLSIGAAANESDYRKGGYPQKGEGARFGNGGEKPDIPRIGQAEIGVSHR